MQKLVVVVRVLLVLLGVATGAVKVAGMEAEVLLFAHVGFSPLATAIFGVVQIAAALAVVGRASRRWGALGLGLTFVVATGVVFAQGMMAFGIFSLLFIAMAGLVWARDGQVGR